MRRPGWGTGPWREALAGGTLVWAASQVVLLLVRVVLRLLGLQRHVSDRAGGGVPDSGGTGWAADLHHWDSNYFLRIASDGYRDGGVEAAFLPGYPLAARGSARVVAAVSGAPPDDLLVPALWAVALVCGWVVAVLTWRVALDHGVPPALATVLLVAGPYSVFLSASYAEGLYLALALTAWLLARRGSWALAGLACGLASGTRVTGLLLAGALALMFLLGAPRRLRRWVGAVGLLLLSSSGLLAYLWWQGVHGGGWDAWTRAQSTWRHGPTPPWTGLYQTAGRVLFASTPDRQLQFGADLVLAGVLVLAVVVWWRRRQLVETALGIAYGVALMTSFTWVSLARNLLTLFPLVLLAADLLRDGAPRGTGRGRPRALVAVVVGTSVTLFSANAVSFALGYWTD